VNEREAEDLEAAIGARFPGAEVSVTAYPCGGEILVSPEGEMDRRFKVDDNYLDSPVVRLLVGAPLTK
jgi:hypothetical protein